MFLISSTAVLLALSSLATQAISSLRVPSFLQEPPPNLLYSNDTGARAKCAAHGNPPPVVSWVTLDGTSVSQVPGLR